MTADLIAEAGAESRGGSLRPGKVVKRVMAGFFGAFGATVVLGFLVLGVLTALWPEWQVAWMMSGTKERVLWTVVPSVALYGTITVVLWRK